MLTLPSWLLKPDVRLADPSRVRSAAERVWMLLGNLSTSMPVPGRGVVAVTMTVSGVSPLAALCARAFSGQNARLRSVRGNIPQFVFQTEDGIRDHPCN